MDTLTKFQYKTLKKLANGAVKLFHVGLGRHTPDDFTLEFNETLRLIEFNLMDDVSDMFPQMVEDHVKQGGDAVIARLTPRGQAMFERNAWDKWVN